LGSTLGIRHLPNSVVESSSVNSKKITNLLNYVQEEYVDTVDLDGVTESTIIKVLEQLDPHSSYIPARDLESTNEQSMEILMVLELKFNIIEDTIVVVAPINGGPSEKLGIRSGDELSRLKTV